MGGKKPKKRSKNHRKSKKSIPDEDGMGYAGDMERIDDDDIGDMEELEEPEKEDKGIGCNFSDEEGEDEQYDGKYQMDPPEEAK